MYDPENFKFPKGESYKDVRQRVRAGVNEALMSADMQTISRVFIASHVDIIKMAIVDIMGTSFNSRRNFEIPNGSVSVLGFAGREVGIEGINIYP